MSFEADYKTACLAYGPLNAALGVNAGSVKRFMQMPLVQDPANLPIPSEYPAIAFTRVSTQPTYAQQGDSLIDAVYVQSDCWGIAPTDAFDLADLLRQAFGSFSLAGTQSPGTSNFVLNMFTAPDPEADPALFRVIVRSKHYFNP